MISLHDLYTVLAAVVPLYVAMILAYGSVRWWGIFTPNQCSGTGNRNPPGTQKPWTITHKNGQKCPK